MDISEKRVLMVVAPTDFKDEEYFIPKALFEKKGVIVKTASLTHEAMSVKGKKIEVNLLLKEATSDYSAIIFVGGPGASIYFDDKTAHSLLKAAEQKGKVIAAICIAPSTLANAGVLNGKKATCFPSEKENLKAKGTSVMDNDVVRDGKIVTANGPAAARRFTEVIIEVL